ncbi:MAG: hypothetical protein PHY31_07340 [Smithellaceae bacterium]|nr:hypothetical protein [Smithellaceae bacterium]
MKRLILLLIGLTVVLAGPAVAPGSAVDQKCLPSAAAALESDLRSLWCMQSILMRGMIISNLSALEDANTVREKLLYSQRELAQPLAPFYGQMAVDRLAALLREHVSIASDVMAAAKSANDEAVEDAEKRWHVNADGVADLLSTVNPNWAKRELIETLYKHLDYTTAEIVARLGKDWKTDLEACEGDAQLMQGFAASLAQGVVKQFPARFP